MFAAFCVFLLSWCLQNNNVGAELAAPQNLTMITLNTNYTLSWDWDQSSAEGHAVNFTTQYVGKYQLKWMKKSPNWSTVCERTSRRSCDLTGLGLYYLGIFALRVRASVDGRHSDWVQRDFCPDKDAAVGPPSKVDLRLSGSGLDVFISDPMTSKNTSMRDNIRELTFTIMYWEQFADTQPQVLDSSAVVVTLPHLKAWTSYCVSVQSRDDYYNKNSSFTTPRCMQTEGSIPWWQILLYFLLSLVSCFGLVLLLLCGSFWVVKTVKATFYPSIQLPPHFQYLYDSPGSDIPRLLTPDPESDLLCDKVTVCPATPVLEVHNPPAEFLPAPPSGLEADSSGRHSRQNSSGSGDSGVYSTGGSSNLRQPHSGQSSVGAEDSGQGPFELEQVVKMKDMAPGTKGEAQRLIADEGIVDMCV